MLRNELAKATDNEVRDYLMHRTPYGGTWLEHCLKNDFTVAQMMRGFDRWKHQQTTIDHVSAEQTFPEPRRLGLGRLAR